MGISAGEFPSEVTVFSETIKLLVQSEEKMAL
jgi:hypothetical protein